MYSSYCLIQYFIVLLLDHVPNARLGRDKLWPNSVSPLVPPIARRLYEDGIPDAGEIRRNSPKVIEAAN